MTRTPRAAAARTTGPACHRPGAALGLAGLTLLLWAAVARAFLPGALRPEEVARLTAAGLAGVPAPRALRLPPPTVGAGSWTWHLLVVCVEFPDRRGGRDAGGPAAWQRALFGDSAAPGHSLADYYAENAAGRLRLDGVTTAWIRADSAASYYLSDGAGNLGGGVDPSAYPHNSQRLVEEILAKLDASYDAARFDNNGDGLVDGLLVVTAGQGVDETAPLSEPANRVRLLAHQFHTTYEVPGSGARFFDYAIVAADAPLGVVAHEVGHLFGLIDLYQSGAFAGADGPFGLGDWSLMATGALLDGGRTPAHLDAWSKARLGFTNPATFDAPDLRPVVLPAAEDSATALRVDFGGAGGARELEYFLLETRRRRGFDAALPGEGLLVYHVNETVQTNSSSARYRVALVQADGLDDLASSRGNRGDAGDPFPAVPAGTDSLTAGGAPNSRAADGSDTGVRLTAIRLADTGATFNLTRGVAFQPRLTAGALHEIGGDGDGVVEAGEAAAADLVVTNSGSRPAAGRVVLFFDPPLDADVSLAGGSIELDPPAGGAAVPLPLALPFRVGAAFPAEGRAVRFPVRITLDAVPLPGDAAADTLTLFIGPAPAFADDGETGAPGWTHLSLRATAADRWHLTTMAARSGSHAWFAGRDNGAVYDPGLDNVLLTPEFIVPAGGRFVWWQSIEAESLATNRAWDGGRVELDAGDGRWTPLTPVGRYPFQLETGSGNPLFGEAAFSGRRGWHRVVCDLAARAGLRVRVRFHFATDFFGVAPVGAGHSGWFVDDVAVVAGRSAPPLTAARQGGVIRLDFEEPAGASFSTWRLLRRPDAPGAVETRVAEPAVGPGGPVHLEDAPPPGRWIYRLEARGAAGAEAEAEAPAVEMPLTGPRVRVTPPYPNPYRPTGPWLTIEVGIPEGAGRQSGQVEIVDVAGRLVTRLPFAGAAGEMRRITWDGRGPAGLTRSGIYFMRVRRGADGGFVDEATYRIVVVN